MPPRNPELPEGTDHIINGAMSTGGGGGAGGSGASTGSTGGVGGPIGSASGGTGTSGTGGTGTGSGGTGGFVASGGRDDTGGGTAPVKQQFREGMQSLTSTAGERARSYAADGKDRACSALDELADVVSEAADSIEERLGSEYGQYARRASDAVSGYADTLRQKDVDELWEDARNLIRKSPGAAVGVAAAAGFVLVRLIKSGLDDGGNAGGYGSGSSSNQPVGAIGSGTTGTGTSSLGGTSGTTGGTGGLGGTTGTTGGTTGTTGGTTGGATVGTPGAGTGV